MNCVRFDMKLLSQVHYLQGVSSVPVFLLTGNLKYCIMFPHMNNTCHQLRLNTVKHYLNSGDSYRKTAEKFHVYYPTVFKWVKLYKEQGEQRLLSNYKRPWNRTKKELEEKIVLLKENDPQLTVRKAKEDLERRGIRISIKGIWGVWKRYGYAGFKRDDMTDSFIDYCPWTFEAKKKFELAQYIFDKGNKKETALILNSIPYLPANKLLLEIPDRLLNLRRRTEKMFYLNERIGLPHYLRETENLYKKFREKKLNYSALRIGIKNVRALGWSGDPEQELTKIHELNTLLKRTGNYRSYLLFEPRFTLTTCEASACAALLKIKQGYKAAQTCRMLLRRQKNPSPYFMFEIGILYGHLENYREAEYWHKKTFNKVDVQTKKRINSHLAVIYLNSGRLKKATHILKNVEVGGWVHRPWILIFRSSLFLLRGMPQKAVVLASEALRLLKSDGINRGIFYASYAAACSYCCLDEMGKAKRILKRILPFLDKYKLKKETSLCRIFLSEPQVNKDPSPTVKIASLVMKGQYFKALSLAKKKYHMSLFYRCSFFFPDIANTLIAKGKSTELPKAILRLPIFNKETPVYTIKFLGELIVYRRRATKERKGKSKNKREYIRHKLSPKETAFLIHLALKAGEPEKEIELESLYKNFWHRSKNPARNLSHLLVRIKNRLKIPSHLLEISYKRDYSVLINRGIFFSTDWDEFEQGITRANAFTRAGEWGFAKREFISAFSLFRSEPFKKMYDDWSDDIRMGILNTFEKEVLKFAENCRIQRNRKDALRVLKRAKKVIKYGTWDVEEAMEGM
jgi:transposase